MYRDYNSFEIGGRFGVPVLYPCALASENINASIGSETNPLANRAKHATDGLDFLESP